MLAAISISFIASLSDELRYTEVDLKNRINDKLNFIQGTAEHFINSGVSQDLGQIISSIASEPDLIFIIIADNKGKVIASNHVTQVGQLWHNLKNRLNEKNINKVKRNRNTLIEINKEKKYIESYINICGKTEKHYLREINCGFAAYRINLEYHYNNTKRVLINKTIYFSFGIIITVFTILLLMQLFINKPAIRIITALREFNAGNHKIRIQQRGENEISKIANSINEVLEKIVKNEAALIDKEEQLRAVIDNTLDAIITINRNGLIRSINPAVEKHLGYCDTDLLGKNIKKIMPDPYHDQHDQYINNYHKTGIKNVIGNQREVVALTKTGNKVPVELSVTEMNINGEIFFTGVLRDISDRIKLRNAMKEMNESLFTSNITLKNKSRTDSLTGLANRGYFDETISTEIRRAVREQLPLSLIMIDVDHFKLYNDCYGHVQGDECLKQIANAMKEYFLRGGELPARYGGEEFCVILPAIDSNQARALAEKLNRGIWNLNLPHTESTTSDRVTISVGVSTLQVSSKSRINAKDIIESADKALYEAKTSGRNKVCSTTISNE
jgi:diguanylate cyclase (GGDEF)-like protein/PAS domain S-box-containing protein